MSGVEPWLEQSLTGVSIGSVSPGRVLIVEGAEPPPDLGVTDHTTVTLIRTTTDHIPDGHYAGSFLVNDGSLDLADGTSLSVKPYGVGAFLPFDGPTVLRVTDDDDFSAYLRDADEAFATGLFAEHVTHPNVLIADLAALGADPAGAGPRHRAFVFPDGTLSTSPTGQVIGVGSDSMDTVDRTWREINARSDVPCAVCLGGVIHERDRSEALLQRPWLARYVAAVRAIRVARVAGRGGDRWQEAATLSDGGLIGGTVGVSKEDGPTGSDERKAYADDQHTCRHTPADALPDAGGDLRSGRPGCGAGR